MKLSLTRRDLIAISCCGAAFFGASLASCVLMKSDNIQLNSWQGMALGANASIQLYHNDKEQADRLIKLCFTEITRLENIFSLYRPDSKISQLNKNGILYNPPSELLELIEVAEKYSILTDGVFDISVQPLWELYSQHFSEDSNNKRIIPKGKINQVLKLVDYRNIHSDSNKIEFKKKGMAITLNSIAQGYITDKITELLAKNGVENILINLGETRGQGSHPDGAPWRVGIKSPNDLQAIIDMISLKDQAVATSGGYGTKFDFSGRIHHIFDSKTGKSSGHYKSISIIAPTATEADALATALSLLPLSQVFSIIKSQQNILAIIVKNDGKILRVGQNTLG